MEISEHIRENLGKLQELGVRERAAAREAGISSYYLDPSPDGFIVEEKEDGSKILMPLKNRPHAEREAMFLT